MQTIQSASLQSLEWPKVVDLVEGRAQSAPGRARVRGTDLAMDLDAVRERLAETDEARRILREGAGMPLGDVEDVRAAVARARKGAVLDAAEFRAVANTLEAAHVVRRRLAEAEEVPLLGRYAHAIADLHWLAEDLRATFGPDGEVVDDASPALAAIRAKIRRVRERTERKMNEMLGSRAMGDVLQDRYFTIRDGRYVLPVRADAQDKVGGIVHGSSGSGATTFIEPTVLVELNNELKRAQIDEEREVLRILTALSADVAAEGEEIEHAQEALAAVDAAMARGRLAEDLDGALPEVTAGPTVRLGACRHPLLAAAARGTPERVVPNDLTLARDVRALVISGPNTGGKTVMLKALGLAALMVRAGLHPCVAEGSALGLFDPVLAHIGDEQSIEESLSTFSAHVLHLREILAGAGPRALVLLDELATGTDPTEGEAIALAVADALVARGATALVTTHYGGLKEHAATSAGFENASVEFDAETLRPTYRLRIGTPGRSYAREIARRLGMDADVIARADALVRGARGAEAEAVDALLRDLDAERSRLGAVREELDGRAAAQDRIAKDLRARERALDARERRVAEAKVAEIGAEIDRARAELKALTARLVRSRSVDDLRRAREDLDAIDARVEALRPARETVEPHEAVDPAALRPGDAVRIASLGREGTVVQVRGREVQVQAGRVVMRVKAEDLARSGGPQEPRRPAAPAPSPRPAAAAAHELDLRGARVDEALIRVDALLDQAALAGLDSVRIIHGHGTGALKTAVRAHLDISPYVVRWRPGGPGEGRDGATVGVLREEKRS